MSLWPISLLFACAVLVALLALYVPTIYIRKTNKILKLLEEIAANTRK
jgi:ABC-type antimicrobial peptide transport system permease subunit